MADPRQGDLFKRDEADEIPDDWKSPVFRADPEKVRVELHEMLDEARAAQEMDWEQRRLYRTIFPQMSNWLPQDEAAGLCAEFAAEMDRLDAA
jgi:hypothetical protein